MEQTFHLMLLNQSINPLCKKKNGILHLTPETWHLTPGTWHLTCDMWQIVAGEYSLKISAPQRFGIDSVLNILNEMMTYSVNQLMTNVL